MSIHWYYLKIMFSVFDVIYLDYAKAFDKVDHALLLKKVRTYGIEGDLFTWIE